MLFRLIISFIFSLSFCFALPSVTMVETSVKSSLNGQSKELALKDEVDIKSEIISDENGKAEIMFDDGSIVNIAASTQILLSDFVDSQESQNILVDMTTGTARFITGEINRKNPEAFKVNTPNATIGIRGTMISLNVNDGKTSVYLHETSGLGVVVTNKDTGKSMELKTPGQIIEVKGENIQQNKATQENSDKIIASFNKIQAKEQEIKLNFGKVLTYPVFRASKTSNTTLDNQVLYAQEGKVVALNTAQTTTQNTLANTLVALSQPVESEKTEISQPVASEPRTSESTPASRSSEPTEQLPKDDSKPSTEPTTDPTPQGDKPEQTDPTTDPTDPQGDKPEQTASWVDNITGVFRGGDDGALIGFEVNSKANISNAYFWANGIFAKNGSTTINDDGEFEIKNFTNGGSVRLSGEFDKDDKGDEGEFDLIGINGIDDIDGDFAKTGLKVSDISGYFEGRDNSSSISFKVETEATISDARFSISDATGNALTGIEGSGSINKNLNFTINGFKNENNNPINDASVAGIFHDATKGIYQIDANTPDGSPISAAGIFRKQ